MVSRDNLLLLQAFLWHLDRKDLHELAADYARRIGDTLYFYAPKEQPEEGFKHIQFHVEGNLDGFHRATLEALRATVARLLFVPQEYIFLSGIEPSGSLTLTFMIHEHYTERLQQLFKEHKGSFGQLGVDGISVDDNEYIDPSLAVQRRASAPAGSASKDQLRVLYDRSLRLESQVEESEIRAIESRADATVARQEAVEWRRKENYFRALLARIAEKEKSNTPINRNRLSLI
ncbi:poly [ADP-ribose] polymerase [Plakobranchus ocellatus]|uniref:Poly [ADP-ribose] polymerase n=1 Tax=Plakobranchus ocellatus TaxID=259542 RepID=A0AAV3Y730_9GAST|nr:poly [ADP-ribose] polymerase [Plakobranchus ocellatus]